MDVLRAAAAGVAGAAVAAALAAVLLPGGAEPAERLRVAYFPNIGHAAPIIAAERGMLEAALGGAGLETRVFDSGPQAIESLFAGSIDAAYVGPGPAVSGHLNSGGDVVVLAGAASGGASLVVHPGSGIGGPGDLAGTRLAAPQMGNTQDVSLRTYLRDGGLESAERGGSVTVHNISNPDIYTLFAKGEIDGAWVPEPWATILVRELGGTRLFHEEELWPDGRFASVLLVASAGYADANPGITSRLLESHSAAVGWINENPEGARDLFNGFLESHLGRPLPDDIVDEALAGLEVTDDPLPESVALFAERAGSLGYLGRGEHDISGLFYGGRG